ncbi:MAG: class I SAM-dependent methyltransferase, partial [Pseudomonadales bacterium]
MMLPVIERYIPRDGRILDGGAGTGLMGETLTQAGFTHLEAMDPSAGLLAQAAKKNIYRETRLMKLGDPLDYPDDTFDGVVV